MYYEDQRQPVFRNLLPLLQPPGESKPLSLGINSSLQCWDTIVRPSHICRLQWVLYCGSYVYSFQPESSFQISAMFQHRVNSDPLLLSVICEAIKIVQYFARWAKSKDVPLSSSLFHIVQVVLLWRGCTFQEPFCLPCMLGQQNFNPKGCNCLCAPGSVARYGVILPSHLKMENVDTVLWGVIYSCPPSGGKYQEQSKPCDPKALFIAECKQVTQRPECFLWKILEISFRCR